MASLHSEGPGGGASGGAGDSSEVNSAEHVRGSRHDVLDRWQALQEVAKERRERLEESRKLQVSIRSPRVVSSQAHKANRKKVFVIVNSWCSLQLPVHV